MRTGEDSGENDIGGSQISQENPRRNLASDGTGPDGLEEAFEVFRVKRIGDPSTTAGYQVEQDGGESGAEQEGG